MAENFARQETAMESLVKFVKAVIQIEEDLLKQEKLK